jgi:hypothetical protein
VTGVTARPGSVWTVKKLVLLAPVAALVLAGCAHDPTVAAKVAGQSIPVSDVSVMAKFLCASATAQSQGQTAVPMTQVNQIAVTYLTGAKVLTDLADRSHVKIPAVDSSAAERLIATLPSSDQSRARALVGEVDNSLSFVAQHFGTQNSQQMLSALASLIQGEVKSGRLVSNPEYPTVADAASGSLSTAVSSVAKTATSAQPDSSYLAALPAGQKCG